MNQDAQILVASEGSSNAELVQRLLRGEFEHVHLSTRAEAAVQDFERVKPDIVFLAFDSLEKAQRYYLALYRLGSGIDAKPHRSVVLCTKDEVREAYALCRQRCFDDYILFWPMTHDTCRLPMAAHHALRELEAHQARATTAAIAADARRVDSLVDVLVQAMAQGKERVQLVQRRTQEQLSDALHGLAQRVLTSGAVQTHDAERLRSHLDIMRAEELRERAGAVAAAAAPIADWASEVERHVAPHLESVRAMSAAARTLAPIVMVVEDDELQRKLVTRLLSEEDCEVVECASAQEALFAVRSSTPGLVLLDLELPDQDGLEVLRHFKATPRIAQVPVAIMTGHSQKDVVVQCTKAGAAAFVVKPLDREVFLGKVRTLLFGPRPSCPPRPA